MKKLKHVVIYEDPQYYSTFPSIVRRPDGELIVAFRRAPDRRRYGGQCAHVDPNSYLVLVRSNDNGETWTKHPELIHAHSLGGSQDPCMNQLADGTIICSSYLWLLMPEDAHAPIKVGSWEFLSSGGYLMRSTDGGRHWQGPILPPPVPGASSTDYFGHPRPALNRGAMLEGADAILYWAVSEDTHGQGRTSVHLMTSTDKGTTWQYRCPIAEDDRFAFNETSLYETPAGEIVAFVRTTIRVGDTVIVRSTDRGHSFQPWQDAGFQGYPHDARRLHDQRVFLVYGYRYEPYGIRARILNPECTDFATAPEIVLRDDGGRPDLGYPWAAVLPDGRVLAVYYFNIAEGTRHIAGTFLDPND